MNPAPTFDRVYGEIRRRILIGGWRPGQRIDLLPLADGLGASITPVRDALYRLVGEGHLVLGSSDGFAAPGITEPELVDRYGWNEMLLELALRLSTGALRLSQPTIDPPEIDVAYLFRYIGEQASNAEITSAITEMNDRLAFARATEAAIGIATDEELAMMLRVAADGDIRETRKAMRRYHGRRKRAAGRIVYAMHRPG